MGQIWNAAKRGEGYDLAREHEGFTWFIIIFASTYHFVVRFFTGRPIFGDRHRKTDARWNVPGTTLYNPSSPMTRPPFGWESKHGICWSRLKEKTRAKIRVGFLVVFIAIGWGWWDGTPFSSSITHDLFTVAGIGFTWIGLHKATTHFNHLTTARRRTHRAVTESISAGLARLMGTDTPADVNLRLNTNRVK